MILELWILSVLPFDEVLLLSMSQSFDASLSPHRSCPRREFFRVSYFFGRMHFGVSGAFAVHVLSHAGVEILGVARVECAASTEKNVHVVGHG